MNHSYTGEVREEFELRNRADFLGVLCIGVGLGRSVLYFIGALIVQFQRPILNLLYGQSALSGGTGSVDVVMIGTALLAGGPEILVGLALQSTTYLLLCDDSKTAYALQYVALIGALFVGLAVYS